MKCSDVNAAREVIRWNGGWLCGESSVAVLLVVLTLFSGRLVVNNYIAWCLGVIAWWRMNEIFYAFYQDAIERLSGSTPHTKLTPAQRIKLAMRSYLSLTLNFAFVSFFMPSTFYDPCFTNFHNALYFSGVTITTLGYGDIKPVHAISKFFAVYEVFSGVLLVVVAIGVYISGLSSKNCG
jgi:voltage-gated potassium channel